MCARARYSQCTLHALYGGIEVSSWVQSDQNFSLRPHLLLLQLCSRASAVATLLPFLFSSSLSFPLPLHLTPLSPPPSHSPPPFYLVSLSRPPLFLPLPPFSSAPCPHRPCCMYVWCVMGFSLVVIARLTALQIAQSIRQQTPHFWSLMRSEVPHTCQQNDYVLSPLYRVLYVCSSRRRLSTAMD